MYFRHYFSRLSYYRATVAHGLPGSYDKETSFLGTDDVFIYVRTYTLKSFLYKSMGEKRSDDDDGSNTV